MTNLKRKAICLIFIVFSLVAILSFIESLFGIPVLCYQRIGDHFIAGSGETIDERDFEEQLQYLNEMHYTTITPAQWMDHAQHDKPLPPNPILLTFDEGYADHYRIVYPLLQKYNMTATFFVTTDRINKEPLYMTWQELSEMQEHGFQIASQGSTHSLLTKLSNQALLAQLTDSRSKLQEELDTSADYFSYPAGRYDMRVMEAVKQVGYRAAFSMTIGRISTFSEPFALNRIVIYRNEHPFYNFWLRLKFAHLLSTLQQLKLLLVG